MNRRLTCATCLAALAALALGALSAPVASAQTAAGPPPEKPKLTVAVGGKATLYYLPLTIAERLDLFRKNGLDVQIVDFAGGSKALQAVVGGSADIVAGAYEHTIRLQTLKQPFRSFVLMGRAPQLAILLRADKVAEYKDYRNLEGAPVGVSASGSSSHMLVNAVLAKAGVPVKSVPIVGIGTVAGQNVAAFVGRKVAALSTAEPMISMIERDGLGQVIADTRTVAGTEAIFGGPMPAASLYAPQAFVDRNPVTVDRLTRSIVEALRWLAAATPDQVADLVPPENLLGDRELYKKALAAVRDAYSPDGLMPEAGPRTVLSAMRMIEPDLQADGVDLSATYTNAVVERLRAGL